MKALDEAIDAVERATREIEEALEASAFDPKELERCEERLFALRAMGRKHNVPIENLPALAQKFADDLAALAVGRSEVGRLEVAVKSAAKAYHAGASTLSAARDMSARELMTAVNAELAPLKLERAEFSVDLRRDDSLVSPSGYDRAEFFVRTNPGSRPGPLMKVASGGELARFLLAIKVRLAERGTAPTLVFDEIDTGVGGAVADAMGQRLARLSARAQVLAVTHAPQVAARAQNHYRIAKSEVGKGERVATGVSRLGAIERREEIARMLAGEEITRRGSRGGLEPDREGRATAGQSRMATLASRSTLALSSREPCVANCGARRPRTRHEPDEARAKREDLRRARLAASLRENLKRRKAQGRARQVEAEPAEEPTALGWRASGLTREVAGGDLFRRVGFKQRDRGWIAYKFAAARR